MTNRTSPFVAAPQLVQQLMDYGRTLLTDRLEQDLVRLVAIRTSQINGSAAGLQLYYSEARKEGPADPRLDLVVAWRDTDFFTPRERAALGWAEALTRVAEARVSDEAYDAMKAHFTDEEHVHLTLMIGVFNSFNRLAAGHGVKATADARPQTR
jgi:alkylhydroperoxidase family enzyme